MNMHIKLAGLCLLGVMLSASSCASGGGVPSTLMAGIADPIGTLMIPPTNQRALTYANTDAFDRELHATLKGSTSPVTITVPSGVEVRLSDINNPASTLSTTDVRLARWVYKVRDSGGATYACVDRPPESGLWSIVSLLIGFTMPIINEYLTYRPADRYHAVIFYDASTERVRSVKMLTRASVADANALTCEAAQRLV